VLNNLIINADQAMPEGGQVTIGAENIPPGSMPTLPYSTTGHVRIYVRDTGVGIEGSDLDKIFDPYFTTKERGSGLGLATCYSIVANHDGLLTAESSLGAGTTMSVFVPASEREARARVPVSTEVSGGQGRILLMDDEEHVLEVCGRMLEFLGYSVEYVRSGKEAVEAYRAACGSSTRFDAIIVDLTVPGGMGGKEAVARLKEIDPDINAIASSGYSNDPVMANYGEFGFRGILAKPYNIQELDRTLTALLT
jgi:CheY-like chemotaxis protein